MSSAVYLTTTDNPFDPSEDFDRWFQYDEEHGYHSCSYLARIARTSDNFSDHDNDLALERAIDEIVRFNLTGKENVSFVKIKK